MKRELMKNKNLKNLDSIKKQIDATFDKIEAFFDRIGRKLF
jgi:hypothetical protein